MRIAYVIFTNHNFLQAPVEDTLLAAAQSIDSVRAVSPATIHASCTPSSGCPPIATHPTYDLRETNGAERTSHVPDLQATIPSTAANGSTVHTIRNEVSADKLNHAAYPARIHQAMAACNTDAVETSRIKQIDDHFSSLDLGVNSLGPNYQVPLHLTQHKFSINPSMQSIHPMEQMRSVSDAPIISSQIYSSLCQPIQTASRFRKARIRETVEQWSSHRVSFHDCRLKALPDWVSDLQAKNPSNSFNNPTAQRSRCLYCFVPGSYSKSIFFPVEIQRLAYYKAIACNNH